MFAACLCVCARILLRNEENGSTRPAAGLRAIIVGISRVFFAGVLLELKFGWSCPICAGEVQLLVLSAFAHVTFVLSCSGGAVCRLFCTHESSHGMGRTGGQSPSPQICERVCVCLCSWFNLNRICVPERKSLAP